MLNTINEKEIEQILATEQKSYFSDNQNMFTQKLNEFKDANKTIKFWKSRNIH